MAISLTSVMLRPAFKAAVRSAGGATSSLRSLSISVTRSAQAPSTPSSSLASDRMKQLLLDVPPELKISQPGAADSNKRKPKSTAQSSRRKQEGESDKPRKPQQSAQAKPRREGERAGQQRSGRQDRPPRQARNGEQRQDKSKSEEQSRRPTRNNGERRPRRDAVDGQQRPRKTDARSAAKREVPVYAPASLLQQLPPKEATEEDLFGTRSMLSEDAYTAALSAGLGSVSEGSANGQQDQLSEKESRTQAAARKAGDYSALLGASTSADATKKADAKSIFLSQAQSALARNASVTNVQRATAIKTLRDRLAI